MGRTEIEAFEAVMTREDRTKGFFVAFDYTSDARREIDRSFRTSGKAIIALTVREILGEEIARNLASAAVRVPAVADVRNGTAMRSCPRRIQRAITVARGRKAEWPPALLEGPTRPLRWSIPNCGG